MKVLLFTHSQDIDGLGCVVLARQSFSDLKFELCKTFEITEKVKQYIDTKEIYNYDKVFVTDLCIKEPILSLIDNDEILKNKIQVLDHHKSEIDEGNDKYDFVNITVESEIHKESGTSLFYHYLVNNSYLDSNDTIEELVEWTRQYDVWDWVSLGNTNARKLHILFENLGYEKYLEITSRIIAEQNGVKFSESEEKFISDFDNKLKNDINTILSKMIIQDLTVNDTTYHIGFVVCPYKYRNDISESVKKDNKDNIDLVGMIMTDTETVSYRSVKDVDVSKIAVYFDGKGHKGAASNLQSNEKFKSILDKVISNQ